MPARATIEDIRRHIDDCIREHGWFVQSVLPGPDSPSFAYTIGLTGTFGHPEVLMIGFDPRLMHPLLNTVGDLIKEGARFSDWDRNSQVVARLDVVFRSVPLKVARKWARGASERYRPRGFELLQMFLPDPAALFPWDKGVEVAYRDNQGRLLPDIDAALAARRS